MFPRTASILCVLFFYLLSINYCFAGEDEPIVWVAEGASIEGTKQIDLYPVSNETGIKYNFDVAVQVRNTIQAELTRAGLNIVEPAKGLPTKNVGIQVKLVHYQAGSIGDRWIGLGGGAAVCIIRTYIVDGALRKIIGDIIVAEQVETGGLFSVGAGKYAPDRAARKVSEELAELLGIELKPGEEPE